MQNRKLLTAVSIFILALGVLLFTFASDNFSKDCRQEVFEVMMVDENIGFLKGFIDGKEVIPENGGDLANGSTQSVITAWYNATDNTVEPNYYFDTYGLAIIGVLLCAIGAVIFLFGRRKPRYY